MAADEMLLASAKVPVLRVYAWEAKLVSVGVRFDLERLPQQLDSFNVVKRPTGGGIVWHGADQTFTLMVPASSPFERFGVQGSYRWIHTALAQCLADETGEPHELVEKGSGGLGDLCFSNPVAWDVVIGGSKVAGGAQRRTKAGFLHQGSVRTGELGRAFWSSFADALAASTMVWQPDDSQMEWVRKRAEVRKASGEWTRLLPR